MGTTYEYNYKYPVNHSNKHRAVGPAATFSAPGMDPLQSIQHDRIWNRLYDPVDPSKITHEAEVQVGSKHCLSLLANWLIVSDTSRCPIVLLKLTFSSFFRL